MQYIDHWSLRQDIVLIAQTVPVVITPARGQIAERDSATGRRLQASAEQPFLWP